jgi:hypothetical protein
VRCLCPYFLGVIVVLGVALGGTQAHATSSVAFATVAGDPAAARALDRDATTAWCAGKTPLVLRFATPVHAKRVDVVRAGSLDFVGDAVPHYTPIVIETDHDRVVFENFDASGDGQPLHEDNIELSGTTQLIRISASPPLKGKNCLAEVLITTDHGPVVYDLDAAALDELDRRTKSSSLCKPRPLPGTVRNHSSFESGRAWFTDRERKGTLDMAGVRWACDALACADDDAHPCATLVGGVGRGVVRMGYEHRFFEFAWRGGHWKMIASDDATFE